MWAPDWLEALRDDMDCARTTSCVCEVCDHMRHHRAVPMHGLEHYQSTTKDQE